jgi:hypothetical protein
METIFEIICGMLVAFVTLCVVYGIIDMFMPLIKLLIEHLIKLLIEQFKKK